MSLLPVKLSWLFCSFGPNNKSAQNPVLNNLFMYLWRIWLEVEEVLLPEVWRYQTYSFFGLCLKALK